MAHNHVVFETGVRYIFNPSLTMRTQFLPETSRVKKKTPKLPTPIQSTHKATSPGQIPTLLSHQFLIAY